MPKFIKLLSFVGIAAVSLILLIPTIVASSFGNQTAVSWINQDLPGKFTIEHINLSWFKGQELTGVSYKNQDGTLLVHINSIAVNAPLSKLIFGQKFKEIIVKGLDAEMADDAISQEKLMLQDGQIKANLSVGSMVSLQGEARLVSGKKEERFFIDGQIPLNITEKNLTLAQGSIKNLPSALIDWLLSLSQGRESKLAREFFGKQINISLKNSDNPGLGIDVESDNFKGNAYFKIHEGTVYSDNKSNFSFAITPKLIAEYFSFTNQDPLFKLESKADAFLDILSFRMDRKMSLQDASCDLSLIIPSAKITLLNPEQPFELKDFKELFTLHKGSIKTETSLGATSGLSDDEIAFTSTAILKNVFLKKGKFSPESVEVDLTANHFPLALFSRNFPKITDAIGTSADVRFSGNYSKNDGRFLLSFLSEHVQLENVQVAIGDEITLQKQASIHINIEPDELAGLISNNKALNIKGKNFKIKGVIEKFSMPKLSKSKPFDLAHFLERSHLKLNAEFQGPALFTMENGGSLVDSAKINFELKKGIGQFDGTIKLEPKLQGPYQEIANENFQINAKGKLLINPNGTIAINETLLKGESPSHQFDALFNYKDSMLQFIKPASIKLKIMPSTLNNLAFAKDGSFNLKKPVQINVSLTPFDYPIHMKKLEHLNLTGDIKMDVLDFFSYGNEFVFKDLAIPFELFSEEKKLKLSPTLKTYMPKFSKEGAIAGKISIKGISSLLSGNYKNTSFKSRLQLMDFPTEILSSFSSFNISNFVGEVISLDLDAQYEKQLHMQASIQGKDLSGIFSIHTNDDLAVLKDETFAEMNFILDQGKLNAIAALVKEEKLEPHFTLLEKTPVKLKISSLNFSLANGTKDLLSNLGLSMQFHIDKFLLNDLKRKQTIALSDMSLSLNTENLSDHLSFKIQALPENGDRAKGALSINGEISNLVTKEGKWDLKNLSCAAKASLLSFSSAAFCDLFCPYPGVGSKVEALLGNVLDADIRIEVHKMSGPLSANIRGGNGMVKLMGRLDHGLLYLSEPLIAEVKATPELGKHIFKDFVPFLQGLESSSSPLRFTINQEGFVFPVKDFNIDSIVIKDASLETGKMVFRNSSELSSLITILKGQQMERQTIWLTPVYFTMKEGKLKLKRSDMLVSDTYHFASWGVVDLVNERVEMLIGVTGNTISKALGINGIKHDAMLQIPFKGPLTNPKIDKSKATAKISALVASHHSPEGKILGTFIDLASGGLLEQDAPSPTTKPFPWGDIVDNSQEDAPDNKIKKKENSINIPIEDIEKGSKKLLKKLFK